MALLYRAELRPDKLDLLNAWLPTRPWYRGPEEPELRRVAAYRFDDPAGEVGVETFVVRAGDGPLLHVPLTYRGAPLDGADRWLVGTTEHSVLGRRWVYDGCADPVYAGTLATAIRTGGGQADEFLEIDGKLQRRRPTTFVTGSGNDEAGAVAVGAVVRVEDGDPTLIVTDSGSLAVLRILDDAADAGERAVLTGTWTDRSSPVLLAYEN